MSRVGKKSIVVPEGVDVECLDGKVRVTGTKGSLTLNLNIGVSLSASNDGFIVCLDGKSKSERSMQGLTRSLVANMIEGVSKGFEKALEVNGIGYKVELKERNLVLNLGYSHPIYFQLPDGIEAVVEKNVIKLFGIDKGRVGQTAASIRRLRPPEPYKGKGVRYINERVRRKAGKTGAK